MTAGETQHATPRVYGLIGIAVVVAHLAIALLRVGNAWFYADDFQNLMIAAGPHKPPGQFLETVFGQYVPLYRATTYALFNLFGLSFAPMLAFLLGCSAVAVAALMWLCARMRLPIAATLSVGAFLACTWIPFEGQSWWSAGLHIMPGAATLCTCLAIAARPTVDLGLGHALALAAVLVVGVMYYNAVLLVAGPVAAIRWYIRLQEQSSSFFARLRGVAIDLLPVIAVALLAAITLVAIDKDRPAPSDLLVVLSAAGQGVTHGVGAAIAGAGGFNGATDRASVLLWGVVGAALIIAVVATSILRSPRVAWLWAGCFAFILVQLVIIGGERIQTFGPWILVSPRYNLSNVLTFIATAIIAFSSRYPARALLPAGALRSAAPIAGALLALAIVASNIATGLSLSLPDDMKSSRVFDQRMRDTAPPGIIKVGDRSLPNFVTPHWTGAYASLAYFARIVPARLEVTPWRDAMHFVADDGALVPLSTLPTEHWTLPGGAQRDIHILPPLDAAGNLTALERGIETDKLSGWANAFIRASDASQIVAVTAGAARPASADRLDSPDISSRFRGKDFDKAGFAITLDKGASVSATRVFLLLDDALAIPILTASDFTERDDVERLAGAPLQIASADLSEAFAENGWFHDAPPPPLPGAGYGSFIPQGDAGMGDMRLTFAAPPDLDAILVPILIGPTGKGMRLTVTDPATGAEIATLADPAVQGWQVWTVDLPPAFAGDKLVLRVEDNSKEWGAWIAIGPAYARKPS